MRTIIGLLLIFIVTLQGARQLALANNKWQLLGVNGVYVEGLIPAVFGASGIVVTDTVDANGQASYYQGITTTASTAPNDSTLGLLAIQNVNSPTGDTTLSLGQIISLEIGNLLTFDPGQTRYRMYLAGESNAPAIRIDFQANLIGKEFKILFGTESIHYVGFFNPNNTYDNPQALSGSTLATNTVTTTSLIREVFDSNLADNNLTQIALNSVNSPVDLIAEIPATEEINATFYMLTGDGFWSLWDSRNSVDSTNGFNSFTTGRAYWGFVTNSFPNPHHGIILGEQGINDETHENLYNGWNMVSFKDSNIRYSPTGTFISTALLRVGVNIAYKVNKYEISLTATTNTQAARDFNWNIQNQKEVNGSHFNAVAFPSLQMQGTGNTPVEGIVIVSDDKFIVDQVGVSNLSGRDLIDLGNSDYSTTFGDYLVGLELGELNGTDINQTININMPSYNSNAISATDLNQTDQNVSANRILAAFEASAQSANAAIPNANTAVYRIDLDFSSTNGANYETILMSSNGRFGVQDASFLKTFRLIRDGVAVIAGSQNRRITQVVDINTFTDVTNVQYYPLTADNNFMIISNIAANLDLLEESGYTMFLDEPTITNADDLLLTVGAIGQIYTHKNFLSARIGYQSDIIVSNITGFNQASTTDGYIQSISAHTDDLVGSYFLALDYPNDGPLNLLATYDKTITQIVTADTIDTQAVGNEALYWSISDLTKDPANWFDTDDAQDIFTMKDEKGYWINVRDFTSSVLSINPSSRIIRSSSVHFDNNVTIDNTLKIGLVTNHINHRLSLLIDGLSPLENQSYDVQAIIRGKTYPMMSNGIRFDLLINDIYMELEESEEDTTNDDAIKIQIFDGLGNTLTNVDYSVNFIKPARPTLTWGENGELNVDSSLNDYDIHHEPILDIGPIDSILTSNNADIYAQPELNWEDTDGNVTLLRVVSKNNGVYSNMAITPFIPLKDAHILQVRNNQEVDKIPYSFISRGILKVNNVESDSGVQITNLQNTSILVAYRPSEAEGLDTLAAFGGTTSMYLRVNPNGGVATTIGYITFIRKYAGEFFYIYYNGSLYQGVFAANDNYAYANNPYDLDSGTLDFSDTSTVGVLGNEVVFAGYTNSVQPIYEPNIIINNSNGTLTPGGGQIQTGGSTNAPAPILPTL